MTTSSNRMVLIVEGDREEQEKHRKTTPFKTKTDDRVTTDLHEETTSTWGTMRSQQVLKNMAIGCSMLHSARSLASITESSVQTWNAKTEGMGYVPSAAHSERFFLVQLQRGNRFSRMNDEDKTKEQLLEVVAALRWQISELESSINQRQALETNLEHQIQERTELLLRAVAFDTTLKRITDKVRDSLDENQILQTVVQEIGQGLGVDCCDTGLYDFDQENSTICYEYITPLIPSAVGCVVSLGTPFHGIHAQLLQGQCIQFCENAPSPIRPIKGPTTFLACPIFDDQGVIGDLWLLKCGKHHIFSEMEFRLVQQVANQCAIALRQARLYQAAQAQVRELEKLNQLKDDFLNTVSHELRTPMSSIKLAIQMLEIILRQAGLFDTQPNKVSRYFQILQDECQREVNLINDLLDLARLDAEVDPLMMTTIDPQVWIFCIAKPFIERAHSQQQQLHFDLDSELPPVSTDISYLERILSELLNNACKYTPAGGIITVGTQSTAAGMELKVSNTGIELSASDRSRIFDRFYRVSGNDPWKHGGTGLGLALVKKLVEQLGGTIQVDSEANQVTFTIQLPLRVSPAER
ncbi:GAF domain-containing sensor histidine kinase [Kovacikia minuta CCNUW1]|uniref:sensor histidine kinase n=1 Tax=Kovacikia minuta TaxID=2931930 RepID=UPI001CCEC2FF|nr:GAF domain-containing sensor histidine kinase [Kovacikia minuta]UBF24089.1 GAF domain-containing sensor histidine kinase [Kovacikia minuta CCNUW1]